jgi:hypothetical protein
VTLKEEIMSIKTYEEYDSRREAYRKDPQYRELERTDPDVQRHVSGLFPKVDKYDGELYRYPDKRFS